MTAIHTHPDEESGHGSLVSYSLGFVLSIVVTLLAFAAVGQHWFSPMGNVAFITLMAIIQLMIQLVLFLHLNAESKPHWNLSAFLFAILIVFVVVGASIWIMYHLNVNMQM